MIDERLRKVAEGYNELEALRGKQRATQAEMIRACVQRLRSPMASKRKEALDALDKLADMLEGEKG